MAELWEVIYDHLYDYIGAYMFLALALTLFTGLPVAIALGGISMLFGVAAIQLRFSRLRGLLPGDPTGLGR